MIKRIIYWLLCLEIYLWRTNIKSNPWREKIKRYFPEYIILYNKKSFIITNHNNSVAYINIPKCASSTLLMTLIENEEKRDEFISLRKQLIGIGVLPGRLPMFIRKKAGSDLFQTNMKVVDFKNNGFVCSGRNIDGWREEPIGIKKLNEKFIFTFVRNPFSRTVSCFQNKYTKQSNGEYSGWSSYSVKWLKNKFFYQVKNFDAFVKHAALVPNCYLDNHLIPQHTIIEFVKNHNIKIDFIGRFENLSEDFQKISDKFNLLELNHLNPSSKEKADWRDYYSPKTAKLIYKRYRKDFEQFGYEDEYPKLLEYLKAKR